MTDHDHDHHQPDLGGPVEVRHVGGALGTRDERPTRTTVETIPCGVQGVQVRILNPSRTRKRALIYARNGDVHLGPLPTVVPGQGFYLKSGLSPIEINSSDALWAVPETGALATTTIYVLSEHYDTDRPA